MQWFHRRSTKCGRGRRHRRRTNSARISHPPPFKRVTKNDRDIVHTIGLYTFNETDTSYQTVLKNLGCRCWMEYNNFL